MRIRLSADEARYLRDQLDIWIEGYKDIDDEMPIDVLTALLYHRELAERIRGKLWNRNRN